MVDEKHASVFMLRHGEVAGGSRYRGVTNDPLTSAGWRQMWDATRRIPLPEMVITSPLARCAEFAGAFARRHRLPLRIDARFRELDFGAWERRTADEIERLSPDALGDFYRNPWQFRPPGGEPLEAMWTRVQAAWREICSLQISALTVTHGGPMRVILCSVLRLAHEQLGQIHVPHGSIYRITIPFNCRALPANTAAR
jgi:broad specificity phosphatase PhoE